MSQPSQCCHRCPRWGAARSLQTFWPRKAKQARKPRIKRAMRTSKAGKRNKKKQSEANNQMNHAQITHRPTSLWGLTLWKRKNSKSSATYLIDIKYQIWINQWMSQHPLCVVADARKGFPPQKTPHWFLVLGQKFAMIGLSRKSPDLQSKWWAYWKFRIWGLEGLGAFWLLVGFAGGWIGWVG